MGPYPCIAPTCSGEWKHSRTRLKLQGNLAHKTPPPPRPLHWPKECGGIYLGESWGLPRVLHSQDELIDHRGSSLIKTAHPPRNTIGP